MKYNISLTISLLIFLFCGCNTTKDKYKEIIMGPLSVNKELSAVQLEKENIYTLLAFALVCQDWQDDDIPRDKRRGYNIGCVLIDKNDSPVFHGLNCINSTDNATQHGEVRAITQYLEKNKGFNLKDFTIYSTLEPCIMCAGMITMTAIKRVVYGQKDIDYSHAFERLAIDTRPIGGFAPYPRKVEVDQNKNEISLELDTTYKNFLQTDNEKVLAKFLTSDLAKDIFMKAEKKFLNFEPKFKENSEVYSKAIIYYKSVIDE